MRRSVIIRQSEQGQNLGEPRRDRRRILRKTVARFAVRRLPVAPEPDPPSAETQPDLTKVLEGHKDYIDEVYGDDSSRREHYATLSTQRERWVRNLVWLDAADRLTNIAVKLIGAVGALGAAVLAVAKIAGWV